jgi:hypothetical protein
VSTEFANLSDLELQSLIKRVEYEPRRQHFFEHASCTKKGPRRLRAAQVRDAMPKEEGTKQAEPDMGPNRGSDKLAQSKQ